MAKIVNDVIFRVQLDDDKAQKQAKGFRNEVQQSTKATGGLGTALKGVAVAAAAAFSVKEVIQFGKAAVQAAGNYEQLRVSFTTFLGSAEKANKVLKDLEKFSTVTPFTPDQVNQAGQALLAFGIEQENLIPTLEKVGTVSAAVGKDFNELATIFGKARTAGTIFSEDINQLTEAGVPIIDELAKVLGVSADQVKKLASEGKVGFADLEQAFTNLTSEGGKFFGLLEAQSETLNGKLSTLQGVFEVLQRQIGEKLAPVIGQLVEGLLENQDVIEELVDVALEWFDAFEQIGKELNELARDLGIVEEDSDLLRLALQAVVEVVRVGVGAVLDFAEALTTVTRTIGGLADAVGVINKDNQETEARFKKATQALFDYGEQLGLTTAQVRQFQLDNQDLRDVFAAEGTRAGIIATKERLEEYAKTLEKTDQVTNTFVANNKGKGGKGNKVTDAIKFSPEDIEEGLDAYEQYLDGIEEATDTSGNKLAQQRAEEEQRFREALLRQQAIEDQIREEQLEKDRQAEEERRGNRQRTIELAVQGLSGLLDISATATETTLRARP